MNILKLFKKKYNGLQLDTRTQAEKDKDWKAEEVYAMTPPVFRVVNKNEWLKYQVRSQGNSGSCVANTVAKMFEIMYLKSTGQSVKFSHAPIYLKRNNKPGAGMGGTNALDIAIKTGTATEVEIPSENLSDGQLDDIVLPVNYEDLNNKIKPSNYLVAGLDFDYAASLVNKLGAVMYWVDTNYSDWVRDIPLAGKQGGGVRHSVTIVDAITYLDKQYLVAEDSWGLFGEFVGQRLISRKQLESNAIFLAVFTDFKYDITDVVEKETFNIVLTLDQKSIHVKKLQDFLKTQGTFPTNIESTGYYGNITAKAVYLFQVKHNVAPINELDQLKGKRVGILTIKAINSILKNS